MRRQEIQAQIDALKGGAVTPQNELIEAESGAE